MPGEYWWPVLSGVASRWSLLDILSKANAIFEAQLELDWTPSIKFTGPRQLTRLGLDALQLAHPRHIGGQEDVSAARLLGRPSIRADGDYNALTR